MINEEGYTWKFTRNKNEADTKYHKTTEYRLKLLVSRTDTLCFNTSVSLHPNNSSHNTKNQIF